jgi:hypothetical protein
MDTSYASLFSYAYVTHFQRFCISSLFEENSGLTISFHVRKKGVKSGNGHFEISPRNYGLRPVPCNGPEGLGQ